MAMVFVRVGEMMEINSDVIEGYGGGTGIRDIGLLESAASMPEATFGNTFLHKNLPSMAAAYCFHLVCNHPFVDGNKRVGAAAAVVFLKMNGWAFTADQDDYSDAVLRVASSEMDKQSLSDFFERHASPPAPS